MTASYKPAIRLQPRLLALSALVLLGGAGMRAAQALDNATATATAIVLQPIAVTKSADLVFGNLVAGNGDVTVATDGARTRNGTAVLPSGVTPAAARFDVTGAGTQSFTIDYTGSDTTLSDGATHTMAIDWITEVTATATPTGKTNAATDATTGTLTSGAAYIYVGAVLTVGSSQTPGTYTGVVKVTLAYN